MQELQGKFKHNQAVIKTLFSQLTETIMKSCATRLDVTSVILAVSGWASVMYATLAVMMGDKDPKQVFYAVDRITSTLNQDIKKQVVMIRGLSEKAKQQEKERAQQQAAADAPMIVDPEAGQ